MKTDTVYGFILFATVISNRIDLFGTDVSFSDKGAEKSLEKHKNQRSTS